jgi:hypothetical protein
MQSQDCDIKTWNELLAQWHIQPCTVVARTQDLNGDFVEKWRIASVFVPVPLFYYNTNMLITSVQPSYTVYGNSLNILSYKTLE